MRFVGPFSWVHQGFPKQRGAVLQEAHALKARGNRIPVELVLPDQTAVMVSAEPLIERLRIVQNRDVLVIEDCEGDVVLEKLTRHRFRLTQVRQDPKDNNRHRDEGEHAARRRRPPRTLSQWSLALSSAAYGLGLVADTGSGHRERLSDALAANIIQLDAFTEAHAHG